MDADLFLFSAFVFLFPFSDEVGEDLGKKRGGCVGEGDGGARTGGHVRTQ